ncbi:MAG: hypothetical protein A2288_02720 [Candidatus Moranbacteria bacterium RIFOXYA12_FULL_44_15]|nr:MAG: hypothetical protein A2288_02720 [Candidatus Moranbacteria bacterium RIFOXYA12_FULL_44_15]OGI34226.1 MAG: hypothetical protein A2259_04115 [Candidatus Moranbacteria bacterium RIFOXYA2_FULL_43_15]
MRDTKNKKSEKKYLGIDYGKSKVGLAVADSEIKIAFVYGTLNNDNDFFSKLLEIIERENVSKIIIGVPSYVNKEETVYDGEKLGEAIKEALPRMKIEYQNEMFTTKMAQYNLIEKGVRGVKKHDDEEAARIILQSWLDRA